MAQNSAESIVNGCNVELFWNSGHIIWDGEYAEIYRICDGLLSIGMSAFSMTETTGVYHIAGETYDNRTWDQNYSGVSLGQISVPNWWPVLDIDQFRRLNGWTTKNTPKYDIERIDIRWPSAA